MAFAKALLIIALLTAAAIGIYMRVRAWNRRRKERKW